MSVPVAAGGFNAHDPRSSRSASRPQANDDGAQLAARRFHNRSDSGDALGAPCADVDADDVYGASWIGCAALYVPVLYLREHFVDSWDERTRRILREELDRRDLLAFQRRIDRDAGHRDGTPFDDRAKPRSDADRG